jgi:hypothetical protein
MDSLPKEITESRSGKEMTQGHDEVRAPSLLCLCSRNAVQERD